MKIPVGLFLVDKMAQEVLINLLRIQRAKLHNLFSGHATTDRVLLTAMALYD